MKTKFVKIVVAILLAALPFSVAFADAKGPNANEFGPATCADGSHFDLLVNPGAASVVGQDTGSTRVGVAMSIFLFAPDGTVVDTIIDKPGKQPTVWCVWEDPAVPEGFFFGGDVLLTPANP